MYITTRRALGRTQITLIANISIRRVLGRTQTQRYTALRVITFNTTSGALSPLAAYTAGVDLRN